MILPSYHLQLPEWVTTYLSGPETTYPDIEKRMDLVIDLSARNIEHEGGPFAAAVFEINSGKLIAPGINLVMQTNCSVVHAEIVAIIIAQQKIGTFDLGDPGLPEYELVSSTEPCAMCLGAVPWAGIASLVCGARDEDARAVGFDEGKKPDEWSKYYEERGIRLTRDIMRDRAKSVLQKYVDDGGIIYNGRLRREFS